MDERVRSLVVAVEQGIAEAVSDALFSLGIGGLEERETPGGCELVVYGQPEQIERFSREITRWLEALAMSAPAARAARVEIVPVPDDWRTAWSSGLGSARLTDRFVVCPGDAPVPDGWSGRIIQLDVGLVFGFGEHPTTRLAASAVQDFCDTSQDSRPCSVLDLGCGTGILSLVAAACGAERIVGLDCDDNAIAVATRNAQRNGVAHCDFSNRALTTLEETFDLVVANVDLPTILDGKAELVRVVKESGRIVLTGFLREDVPRVTREYDELGVNVCRSRDEEEWSLLELERRRAAR